MRNIINIALVFFAVLTVACGETSYGPCGTMCDLTERCVEQSPEEFVCKPVNSGGGIHIEDEEAKSDSASSRDSQYSLSCYEYMACVRNCEDDSCEARCEGLSNREVVDAAEALAHCQYLCSGDAGCTKCEDERVACTYSIEKLDCGDMYICMLGCETSDCEQACFENTTPEGVEQALALNECVRDNCPGSVSCAPCDDLRDICEGW